MTEKQTVQAEMRNKSMSVALLNQEPDPVLTFEKGLAPEPGQPVPELYQSEPQSSDHLSPQSVTGE